MNNRLHTCLLVLAMLLVSANAMAAARWDSFEAAADCEGWALLGDVKIGSSHPFIDLTYDVTLSQDGALVEQFEGYFRVWMDAYPVPLDEFKPWTTELDGNGTYEVVGTFTVPYTADGDSVRSFTQTIDCGGGEVVCARMPWWWACHSGQWPVDSLAIGGQTFTRHQLVAFLHMPAWRLQSRLTRHLIAAKLNVAAGVEGDVDEAIAAGDRFLTEHPLWSWLGWRARCEGRHIKNMLRDFNRMGCGDKSAAPDIASEGYDPQDDDDLYGWGEIKSMYR